MPPSPTKSSQPALASLLSFTLVGCLGGPSTGPANDPPSENARTELPEWVSSPPNKPGFVYGVGSAQIHVDPSTALNRAQDRARSELVKRLEVTISSQTESRRSQKVENGESRVTRSFMERVESEVPQTELANIEIRRTFAKEEGDTAYALARLNRSQAKQALGKKIEGIDDQLRDIASQETQEGHRLQRLTTLIPALPLLKERRQLLEKLDLVAQGDPGHRLPDQLRDIKGEVANILDSLVVGLQSKDEANTQMASTLRKSLADEGVQVRRGKGEDLTLRYEAGLRTVERDERYFVFADGNVTVVDPRGSVIGEFQKRVKAGSVDEGVARDRAIAQLAEGLGEKLGQTLLDSLQRAGGH